MLSDVASSPDFKRVICYAQDANVILRIFYVSEEIMVNERESVTAKICAFVRAWHSNRARQKIYDDYLAYDMLGKEEYDSIYELISSGLDGSLSLQREDTEQVISEYFAPIPLSRIHFNESRLMDFARENGKIQYVICGAGSDTFAFRNDNEDIEVFEIDHPDTQRYKLERYGSLNGISPIMCIMCPLTSSASECAASLWKQALILRKRPSSAYWALPIILRWTYSPILSGRWRSSRLSAAWRYLTIP